MKKQVISILFSVCVVLVWAAGSAAELTLSEIIDSELIEQAIQLREKHPELFKGAKGVLITGVVKDSQAEKNGLQRGDIVISYAGQLMDSVKQLVSTVQANADKPQTELQFIRKNAVQRIILKGGQIGVSLTDLIITEEILFIAQLVKAAMEKDVEKPTQLFQQNPKTAKQAQQILKKASEGEGDMAEIAKLVSKFLTIVSQLLEEMNRLQKEGEKACYEARYQEALEKWNKGLELAKKAENKQAIGAFLGNIGIVYNNLGQYDKALEYYQQALKIKREIKDRRGEGNDLTNIGVVYSNLGQYDKALGYHQQALEIRKEIKDRQGESIELTNIGVVYDNLGQYDKSLKHYQQALEIEREIEDRQGELIALANIGVAYVNLGQYDKSLKYHQQALEIHKEIKDRWSEGKMLTNIGVVYNNLGQYDKALGYYQQALKIKREIKDKRGEGNDLGNIGNTYQQLGQYEKALEYYKKTLVIFKEIGNRNGEGKILTNIGVVGSATEVMLNSVYKLYFIHY